MNQPPEVIIRRPQSAGGVVGNATISVTQSNMEPNPPVPTNFQMQSTRWVLPFSPTESQRNWFFLIRLAESIPGINTFYNFWLDDEEPPTPDAIKSILGCLSTVDTLLLAVMATFVSAVNFDELTEHNLRFSKQGFQWYQSTPSNVTYNGFQYNQYARNIFGAMGSRDYYPSVALHSHFSYGFSILFMSLTCVIYTYVEVFSKDFCPFPGGESAPDNKIVRLAWWRVAKWVLLASLILYFIGSIFVMLTLDALLLIKIPNGAGCKNYADPAQTLTGSGSFTDNCPIQFRRAILTLIPSTIGAGILLVHSLATANRYRVIRLIDARRRIEQLEPFQKDDERILPPTSPFAQSSCLPCWTCPDLDNDPARNSAPTATTYAAYCCDDLRIEQRVYDPERTENSDHGLPYNGGLSIDPSTRQTTSTTSGQTPPTMTNIQPNAPIYISPPQPPQPLAPIGSTMFHAYPTTMGAPPVVNPAGGVMLSPMGGGPSIAPAPSTGSVATAKNSNVFFT